MRLNDLPSFYTIKISETDLSHFSIKLFHTISQWYPGAARAVATTGFSGDFRAKSQSPDLLPRLFSLPLRGRTLESSSTRMF